MTPASLPSGARPELLAPAGDPTKLRTALHFGADAVYLGMKRFSLRAAVGNFTEDELEWAVAYAHERGRKVYVAVNIQPFDSDFPALESDLARLARIGPDALIVADPGVLALARRVAPALPLHLSTQASVTNGAAARWWLEQGLARVIVARELDLAQLAAIAAACPRRVEAFAHGAVCIAFSGRCLLSLYWADRDTRRGACAQACRWPYREIEDRRRPGQGNPVEEDERGTYFFDAKDLCALPLLDRLVATGVASLKIEGRTRSAYYVGVTVDVYRHALGLLAAGDLDGFRAAVPGLVAELARPQHRGFSTHFLGGEENDPASFNPTGSFADGRTEYVGQIEGTTAGGLVLRVVNPVRPGDELELRDAGMVVVPVVARPLVDVAGRELAVALPGTRVILVGGHPAGSGALVRKAPRPAPLAAAT